MKVALGRLAREGIEDIRGGNLSDGVEAALHYYAGRLGGRRPHPDLPPNRAGLPGSDSTEVELRIAPPLGEALERDAKRQSATLDQLITHAVLIYLAAWDRIEAAGWAPPRPG